MSERPACVGEDPELFFDPHAGATVSRICASCPVLGRCFVGALRRGEEDGWWSGEWFGPDLEDPMVVAEPPARIRPTVQACPGSRGRYNAGCRCRKCTEENRLFKANYDKNGPVTRREKVVDMQVPMFEGVSA